MSGIRLKAFIITIQVGASPPEVFYILARNVEQARLRARQLRDSAGAIVRETVAA